MNNRLKTNMFAVVALAMAFAGCNNRQVAGDADASQDGGVKSFPVSMSIKSAQQCYRIADTLNQCEVYLTLSTSAQWPEKLGDYDLSVLHDSIVARMYDKKAGDKSIDKLMTAYVIDAAAYELGTEITAIDSVPSESAYNNEYYSQCDLSMLEVNEGMATFDVSMEQYMGGAHPMWASWPFTYDLKAGRIVTVAYLFRPGYESRLIDELKQTVAAQLNLTVPQLESSMFTPEMPVSDIVFIRDGQIVFHYNPYDILPYSYGAIDAAISPYGIRDILTPAAQKLLD